MRVAIEFDPQPDPRTEEIENCLSLKHDMLAAKLQTIQLGVRKRPPKPDFRLGRIAPHLMRASQQLRFRGHHFPTPTPPLKGRGYFSPTPSHPKPHQLHTIPVSLNGLGSNGGIVAGLSSHCQYPTSIQRPSLYPASRKNPARLNPTDSCNRIE